MLRYATVPTFPVEKGLAEYRRSSGRKIARQEGYASFAVSLSGVDSVVAYIEKQADHHSLLRRRANG